MSKTEGTQPRIRKDGVATRLAILLAAEDLFSQHGFDGVSIRDITRASNVDLALVNYHFKSKVNLFHEVLAMRVDEMNEKRVSLINNVAIIENNEETIFNLLNAFCNPFVVSKRDDEKNIVNYRRLIGLVSNSRRWQDSVFQKHYDPIVKFLADKISQTLPSASKVDIYWSLSFFIGSLANAYADTRRVDRFSDGLCNSSDLTNLNRKLIIYTVGGILALAKK